jgi:DNA-binding transcriptional ArsR family regulator
MDKSEDQAAQELIFKALSHRLRRRIMDAFLEHESKELSPKDLANRFRLPLSNVGYHVRVLERCNAITLVRTEPMRGSVKHFYVPTKEFRNSPWVLEALAKVPKSQWS